MYSLQLTAEQLEIRETVCDFVAREIKPAAIQPARLEAGERRLPDALFDQASQMGLRTLALAEEAGGAGADTLTACLVAEELAAGDADFATTLAATSRLGHLLFDCAMSAEQRARYLPRFVADDRFHLALADHEPGADGEIGVNYHRPLVARAAVKTTAVRQGNGDWVVNGVKSFSLNAPLAKLIAVEVNTAPTAADARAIGTLLVTPGTPGLAIREHGEPNAWYHGTRGELTFTDCRVEAANMLSADGARVLAGGAAADGDPQFAAINLGIGRAACEAAIDYAKLRVQGGRPIIEHQAIGTLLAEIAIKLEAARNMIREAAWAADHAEARADRSLSDLPLGAIARVFTAEAVHEAALAAAECFGAMGVMRDMPLQKYVRDALICLHAAPGNNEAKLRIAEAVAGYARP